MRASSWILSLLLAVLGIGFLHTVNAAPAAACSCAAPDDADLVENVDVIASVTLGPPVASAGELTYSATVTRVWKGDPASTVTVTTSADEASCGVSGLSVGTEMVLWGFGSSDTYSTNLCSQPADEATALQLAAEAFGGPWEASRAPAVDPSAEAGGWSPWLIGAVVVVAVAAVGGLVAAGLRRLR